MDEKEVYKQEKRTFLDSGETVEIAVMPSNWFEKILQRIGLKPKFLAYTLRKIRVGNRERIGLRLYDFPDNVMDGSHLLKKVFEISKNNNADLIYCAAVCLQNDKNEPSKQLLDALKWIDEEQLFYILDKGLSHIDIENFLKSIVLISGAKSLMQTETK